MIKEVRQVLIACGLLLLFVFGVIAFASAQTIGKTKTEEFKADFEKKKDISAYLDYDGPQIPIQILKCGISDEIYEMYPELKEKKVGLGVANISMEYLENLNRFTFTEDKTEIKNRLLDFVKNCVYPNVYYLNDYSININENITIIVDDKTLLVYAVPNDVLHLKYNEKRYSIDGNKILNNETICEINTNDL